MRPPTVSLRISNVDLRVDTGELLFPVLVLVFCTGYYMDTRGLPSRSLLYAEPLLYATTLLAVVTIFGQAISVSKRTGRAANGNTGAMSRFIGWGDPTTADPADETVDQADSPEGFGLSSATGLVMLLTAYIASLYFVPFVVATAGFLAGAIYQFGERNPVRIVAYSVGFTLLVWIVFVDWLLVPLP